MSKPLFDLLCGLYPRPADLRRFLEQGEQGVAIASHLPDEVGSARVADEGVKELVRRGLVQDALERAAAEFPRRLAEILATAEACGVTLAMPAAAATPPQVGVAVDSRRTPAAPAAPAAPLRWLHLSDLHVGCRGEAAWWQMLDEFWRSVDAHLEVAEAPDLILLTGDLTYQGTRAEFERLTKFLQRLFTHLPRAADGLPPLVVAVPGNHDLQRPAGRDALQYRILRDYDQGTDDPDVKLLRQTLWDERDASLVRPLFANYLAWSEEVIRPQSIRPGVNLHSSFFPGDLFLQLDLPGRFPLALVGLNSAWLQYQGGDFAGKLALPVEQFQAALPRSGDASPLDALRPAHRALLLMHHPRSWLSKPQIKLFDSAIYPGERFVACLHGHMHEPDAVNSAQAGGAARTYYQAPSLFGVERYGGASESRAIGYTWASLGDDGELRARPLRFTRKGDGAETFDRDPFFHWDPAAGDVLLRPGDGRRWSRPRASGGGPRGARPDGAPSQVHVEEPAALLAYRTWLLEQSRGVKLIGVGGGNMMLDLDAIYVPLRARAHVPGWEVEPADAPPGALGGFQARISPRGKPPGPPGGPGARTSPAHDPSAAVACEDFEVERLFQGYVPTAHALVLGDPGSGKTTALLKLEHLCAREDPTKLGLDAGTIPVPLRLRRFTAAREGQPLAAWLQDELDERSAGVVPAELGAALWKHGRLLLLADGLDEVADEALRARLCQRLEAQLRGTAVRAVVSCRHAGYRRAVQFGESFTELELRPLSAEQVDRLAEQWFAEAARVVLSVSQADAQERGRGLIEALHSPAYSSQRLQVMVSTPLLLTLLCVIVHQGRPMPRSRAEYYERCLEVLLLRWGQEQKRRDPPLAIDRALAVLRPLAYALQASGDRDTRMRAELGRLVNQRLRQLGLDRATGAGGTLVTGAAVVDWLQRDAGVLQEFAPEHLGFAHLGLQEYLAATHIVGEGEALLDELCKRLGDPWWHEVARLVAAQRLAYVPLMGRVLRTQLGQGELLAELLDEAPEAEPTPLLGRLAEGGTPREVATLLRLLRRFSGDEQVRAAATKLTADADAEVKALAAQVLEARAGEGTRAGAEVVLVFLGKQRPIAEAVEKQLRADGVSVFRDLHGHLPDALGLQGDLEAAEVAPCVVALCGQHGPPWAEAAARSELAYFADANKAIAWALVPGGGEAAWPAELGAARRFDLRERGGLDELRRWVATSQQRGSTILREQSFVEVTTGMRFLWVPGGVFEMGMKGVAEPVHRVRLSPYWLAETPVTNAQYAKFLADGVHEGEKIKEPAYWRERRFSHPEQPVVGVSWDEAMRFCKWLSQRPELRNAGITTTLPSEAQWEFAARGTDGRRYPWGNEEPDASRAVFGRQTQETTAPVGSCPQGKGPFGHLDLAGNVWQWCRDGYNVGTYEERQNKESRDPVAPWKDAVRILRGSPWGLDRVRAAAERLRGRSGNRLGLYGFRVVAEPASP